MMHVVSMSSSDREPLAELLTETGSFSPEEIGVALALFDMMYGEKQSLARSVPEYEFVGARDEHSALLGYACFGPTPSTDGTYDVYWLAVHPAAQRRGVGRALLRHLEAQLKARGARLVVAEASGRADQERTRQFYARSGYDEVARVRDFYGPDDDRVLLTKRLYPRDRGAGTR